MAVCSVLRSTRRRVFTEGRALWDCPGRCEEEPLPAGAGAAQAKKTLYCSFCFKSQHQVRKLISGPANIFICDECVGLCNEIVDNRMPTQAKTSPEELPAGRLLERLQPIEDTIQGKGNQLQWVVDLRNRLRASVSLEAAR